jgi:hypothetical protein
MSLNKSQHIIVVIDGIDCRVVESDATKERVEFLQKLLQHNSIESKIQEKPAVKEGEITSYTIATPDVSFNPIVKVYNRELRTFEGHRVTPDYWNQSTRDTEPNYWDLQKKSWIKKT